jgi:hypothetical protein
MKDIATSENKTYSLSEIFYSKSFELEDMAPVNARRNHYDDDYRYTNRFDARLHLPDFVKYLFVNKYNDVVKVFNEIGLPDGGMSLNETTIQSSIIYQIIRSIELYVSSTKRDNIFSAFKLARQEKLKDKDFFLGKKVEFSAHPWDIATMSMRGIASCMSWHSSHPASLAGSILDPYCGIIYLSDNTLRRGRTITYGSGMAARAVVRIVKHKDGYMRLLLERLYLEDKGLSSEKRELISSLFKNYLKVATGIPVIDSATSATLVKTEYICPYFHSLEKLPNSHRSYRDSGINYETIGIDDK